MTTTLSQSPLDYYSKQTLGQYGLSPTSPFADQTFAQLDSDMWHHQQQAQLQVQAQFQATAQAQAQAQVQTQAQMAHQSQPKFYISPKAVMPRTSSESPSLLPLDLEAASFGDSLSDSMFQSSPPIDASQMLFQQFTSPPTAAPVSAPTTITGSSNFDFLGSPTFSIHTSPISHRKTISNASSSCSMRSSLSPPPRPSKVNTTANSHNQVQSQTQTQTQTPTQTPTQTQTQTHTRNQSGSSRRTTLPPKKTTHNMIEKRYRNNLNDKIAALRDSIPAMRVMVHRLENQMLAGGNNGEFVDDEDAVEHQEDLDGLEPASKVNKATILSKATEYIAHLEAKNKALAMENVDLKTRVSNLEAMWK